MPVSESPFFSIVIPSFNSAKYINQSLQSVLDQRFSNWEILIIDNFSTDGTDKILNKYVDHRIKIFKINNHGSISMSRNLGIKEAKGRWIAFLDADDWWEPHKLLECREKIRANVDFIYHDLAVISSNRKNKDLECRQLAHPVIFDLILNGNPIATSSVVVKSSILKKVGYMNESPDLIKTADYNTWLRIARITDSFLHIPKKLGYYRIHESNISDDMILQSTLEAIAEFSYLFDDQQHAKIKNRIIYSQARLKFINKNYPQAVPDLIHVIKHGSLIKKIKSLFMLVCIFFK